MKSGGTERESWYIRENQELTVNSRLGGYLSFLCLICEIGSAFSQSSVDIAETAWALPSDWPVSKSLNDPDVFSKSESAWVLSCKQRDLPLKDS